MTRQTQGQLRPKAKEFKMTLSSRTQFASIAAALFCAFVTIGMSVAPAINSVSSTVA